MDFLQSIFDIQTIKLISGLKSDVEAPRKGTPVFVSGKKISLFNAYDACEFALKDELLSIISDRGFVEAICNLMMDDFVRAKDEAEDVFEILNWFTATNIAASIMMEAVLPKKSLGHISLRMQKCMNAIFNVLSAEELFIN